MHAKLVSPDGNSFDSLGDESMKQRQSWTQNGDKTQKIYKTVCTRCCYIYIIMV